MLDHARSKEDEGGAGEPIPLDGDAVCGRRLGWGIREVVEPLGWNAVEVCYPSIPLVFVKGMVGVQGGNCVN